LAISVRLVKLAGLICGTIWSDYSVGLFSWVKTVQGVGMVVADVKAAIFVLGEFSGATENPAFGC